ncbi:MAG: SCP2 sterol-binding domain-containing protein [Lachnospiraceae bacterium]|nr:SCP2 sterol-binding domain-containing protein [Lachnospiraceae bacterium]
MTYEEIFNKIQDMTKDIDVSMIQEHLAYQFNIRGEGEGAFYIEVKEGKLYVEPYEYYDRDAIFICTSEVLFQLMSGSLDPVKAFTIGKLKVEGDLGKALKLKEFISAA